MVGLQLFDCPPIPIVNFLRRILGPDDVTFRTKPEIALDQIRRCLDNGIRIAAWTIDELHGRDGGFLNGLDALGQTYVAEVPCNFTGWVRAPRVLLRATRTSLDISQSNFFLHPNRFLPIQHG
ncbi:MAG: transposase [Planctomycetes bacterium]|nr:transposase [Planctomycetota bacterium]